MKGQKVIRKVKKGSKSSNVNEGPGIQALSYRGPVVPRPIAAQTQTVEVLLTYNANVTTNSSGQLSFSLGNSPSGSTEWLSASALWEEYRTLVTEVIYAPLFQNFIPSGATTAAAPLIMWSARDATVSIPTSYNTAWQIGSARLTHSAKTHKQTIRMSGVIESEFTNTSSVSSSALVGFYAENLTVSTFYAVVFARWLVQFRGRR